MARVKFSPIVTNISGSVGGVTFQRNKFGHTMRQKPLPPKSATSAQLYIRTLIASLQASWAGLTDVARLQWVRYPDFSGQTIKHDKNVHLSGQGLYIKYQLLLLLMGKPLLTTLNYAPIAAIPVFSAIQANVASILLRYASAWSDADVFFIFKISSPRSPTKRFSSRGLRWMYIEDINSAMFQIFAYYVAAFGASPSVGATVHFTIQAVSLIAPVMSTPVPYTVVIAAIP